MKNLKEYICNEIGHVFYGDYLAGLHIFWQGCPQDMRQDLKIKIIKLNRETRLNETFKICLAFIKLKEISMTDDLEKVVSEIEEELFFDWCDNVGLSIDLENDSIEVEDCGI